MTGVQTCALPIYSSIFNLSLSLLFFHLSSSPSLISILFLPPFSFISSYSLHFLSYSLPSLTFHHSFFFCLLSFLIFLILILILIFSFFISSFFLYTSFANKIFISPFYLYFPTNIFYSFLILIIFKNMVNANVMFLILMQIPLFILMPMQSSCPQKC